MKLFIEKNTIAEYYQRCFGEELPESLMNIQIQMSDKITALKEKFRLALTSTAKVIADDFDLANKQSEKEKKQELNSIEIENLTKPSDFIKLRAETDSAALKKKFSNDAIYKKNLPSEFIKELDLEKSKMNIQRFKGLGEMNPEELWSTTLDPETRNLLQVQYSKDLKKDQSLIHTLMGNDVALRKDFIISNAINVQNLDI